MQRAEASVARAQVMLEQEQAEGDVAREEWGQLNPGVEPTSLLVLRVPQIREAVPAIAAPVIAMIKSAAGVNGRVVIGGLPWASEGGPLGTGCVITNC